MWLWLLACGPAASDSKDSDPWVDPDPDADGYTADQGDCDQGDAAVHPEAAEVCNEKDDDCDGLVDDADTLAEGAGDPWYPDADADSFGAATGSITACDRPEGYTADATDCDDADPAAWPGQIEACNEVDDDCDGLVDEAGATGEATWYPDDDGDGFAGDGAAVDACSAPEGYVDVRGDCDDADAATWPGATESCDDADRDCDGDPTYGAADVVPYHPDADGDGFGDPLSATWACEPGEGLVEDDSDCDDTDATISPAALETCDDVDEDCDGVVDEDAVDAPPYYEDLDGDGVGGAEGGLACAVPDGFLATGGDCDDADPAVFPGAAETCDGFDQDCDGAVDEAGGETPWYPDLDGDGYGDETAPSYACALPAGYLLTAGDCDDTRSDVYPGAEERCDHLDHNCLDGVTDEVGAGWEDAAGTWTDELALLSTGAAGDPLLVGDQSSYDLVIDEGTLHLCTGTWYLKVIAANAGTTLAVVGSGPDLTTITTGGSPGSIVAVTNATVDVEGLTITGGLGSSSSIGGAVVATQSSGGTTPSTPNVTLRDVSLTGNTTQYGGAIAVQDYAWVALVDSVVEGNSASVEGGGVWVEDGGKLSCTASELGAAGIVGNTAPVGGGVSFTSTTRGTLDSIGCDWGDNDVYDVQIGAGGYCWGEAASLGESRACAAGACTASTVSCP